MRRRVSAVFVMPLHRQTPRPGLRIISGCSRARAQVEDLVPRIVSEHQGVPGDKVTLDARIVQDPGID